MTKAEHTLRIISILLFVDSRLNKIEILGKELPVISASKDFLRSLEIVGFDIKSFNSSDCSKIVDKDNISSNNNTENFAPEGNIVGQVPKGTGLVIRANRHVEVFKNTFENNSTIGVALVAGDLESGDDSYDPYPRNIQIYDNFFNQIGL